MQVSLHLRVLGEAAGGVGGCLGVIAGSPLDVVRVRLQQSNQQHTGFFSLLRTTVNHEGPFALFRGLFYPLVTAAAQNALV
jgi:solute carrier family 25 (mitochondrial carnitine/acylcarnitine transporter), member 20/29